MVLEEFGGRYPEGCQKIFFLEKGVVGQISLRIWASLSDHLEELLLETLKCLPQP